ncbi:MAG: hypothetical protein F6K56_22805 [Moorea sp. SIO3G5]|nr:hypothetical protein [Moorena sp. SIO3G5]
MANGCISFLLFDPVGGMGILPVSFPTGCPNPGVEAENEGEPLGGALRGGLSQHWRSRLNMMASPPLTHPTHPTQLPYKGRQRRTTVQPFNLQPSTFNLQPST